MSNKKQSSIDWLLNELKKTRNLSIDGLHWSNQIEVENAIKQAKAMHKEEIVKAWKSGVDYRDHNGHGSTYLEIELGEQPNKYYNETFNQ